MYSVLDHLKRPEVPVPEGKVDVHPLATVVQLRGDDIVVDGGTRHIPDLFGILDELFDEVCDLISDLEP